MIRFVRRWKWTLSVLILACTACTLFAVFTHGWHRWAVPLFVAASAARAFWKDR